MSRRPATVRPVTPDLHEQFVRVWLQSRIESGSSPEVSSRAVSDGRVAAALDRADVQAYLAFHDDVPIGYMLLTHGPLPGLTDTACVSIDHLYVVESARRHGAARALLATAASYAERSGAEQITTQVPSQGRDANRFFARLGFSSYVVRRITTTAALRRKLAVEQPQVGLSEVVRRRRSLRARASASGSLVRS